MTDNWKSFANDHNFVIIALGFTFSQEDWISQQSYQFPGSWSGKAVFRALEDVSSQIKVKSDQLSLFGISAGAQYVHRFAINNHNICKAVALHAAGGYTLPTTYIPVKFLVTVGALDNADIKRVDFAKKFVKACQDPGIDIKFHILPGRPHGWFVEQDELSRGFFVEGGE